ncbi:MAG: hypothetical protein SPD11_13365 [Sphaerochaetaceae bacterium]|nr:hypothetical protein [Sphaerochaetaceae bacterium]
MQTMKASEESMLWTGSCGKRVFDIFLDKKLFSVAIISFHEYDELVRISSYAPDGFIPLDNSAIIYPPTEACFNANTFRVSMDLNVPVVPQLLEQALRTVLERLPYFKVSLHEGFFWYYLSPSDAPVKLFEEKSYPCGRLDRRLTNGYLFKVCYTDRRIALEFFHALTDGTGGLMFLKLLVQRYLELSGCPAGTFPDILSLSDAPSVDEFSDPFQRWYDPEVPSSPAGKHAFHLNVTESLTECVQVISGVLSASELKELSHAYQATVTEFLAASLLDSFRSIQAERVPERKRRRPVMLSIPVNLRKVFGESTMRNFTLFATVGIEPALGDFSFQEIVDTIHHQLKLKVDRKALTSQMKRNVGGERSYLLRFIPNFLKRPMFKLLSDSLGDNLYSSVISNLGMVQVSDPLSRWIDRCDFYLSPGKVNKLSCAVAGCGDAVIINFTSFLEHDTAVERLFFSSLVRKGLHVKIQTNRAEYSRMTEKERP